MVEWLYEVFERGGAILAITEVDIYTDGACSGNPGVGAWAAILSFGGNEKELVGAVEHTTNNRMELSAVIEALAALKFPCKVNLYSDSAYVVNAINQDWLENWKRRNWKNAANQPVSNQDLWQALDQQLHIHDVTFIKVKGHDSHVYNNRCDELAVRAVRNFKEEHGL